MEASDHAEPLAPGGPGLDVSVLRGHRDRATAVLSGARFAIAVYLATRALLLIVALVNGTLRHHAFTHELSQWDGLWYRELRVTSTIAVPDPPAQMLELTPQEAVAQEEDPALGAG